MTDESATVENADVEASEATHSRRDAIVKMGVAGAAGAAVWMSPAVLSSVADAAGTSFPGCDCGNQLTIQAGSWTVGPAGASATQTTITNANNAVRIFTVPPACVGSTATFSWSGLSLSGTSGVSVSLNSGSVALIPPTASPLTSASGSFNFIVPATFLSLQLQTVPPLTGTFSIAVGMELKFCG